MNLNINLLQENFHLLTQDLDDPIILLNQNLCFSAVNRAYEKIFHCKEKKLLGLNYLDFCQRKSIEPAFTEKKLLKLNNLYKLKSKTKLDDHYAISWVIKLVQYPNKVKKNYLIIGKVVTGKPCLQDIFPYKAAFLENLFKDLPGHIYIKDEEGIYIGSNDLNAKEGGFKNATEILGKTDFDASWHKKAKIFRKTDKTIIKKKLPKILEETGILEGGEEFTFLSHKIPFQDDFNNFFGLLGLSIDITDQVKKAQRLEQEKAESLQRESSIHDYLESLIYNLPDNIYWKDREGRYLGCNNQQAACFNLSKEQFIGKTIYDLAANLNWDFKLADSIAKNDQEVMLKLKTVIKEESVVWSDGRRRIYLSRKIPATNKNGICIGLLGISTDITDRKRMEVALKNAKKKAELLNQIKTQLISNLSHDLRTPLAGISGILENLLKELPHKFSEDIRDTIAASKELLHLLNEVIDLAKIESGDSKGNYKIFSVRSLINSINKLFIPILKQKNLKFSVNYSEDIPDLFYGYPMMIHRVIVNLVGNALKFTHQGEVKINISLEAPENYSELQEDHLMLLFSVQDTGIGIEKPHLKMIFDRFQKLDTENQYKGTGLGLYISKKFIEQLGGKIKVKSKPEVGSNFYFNLPLKRCFEPLPKDEIKNFEQDQYLKDFSKANVERLYDNFNSLNKQKASPNSLEPIPILLVEDNILIQKGTSTLLNFLNCQVNIAATGVQALKLSQQKKYSLIFMDLNLPKINGKIVINKIRHSDNINKNTPIVVLSAVKTSKLDYPAELVNDVYLKPLSEEDANEILQKYVYQPQSQQQPENEPTKIKPVKKKGLFDFELLKKKYGYADSSSLSKIFELFIKILEKDTKECQKAYRRKDLNQLAFFVHSICGGAATCCATPLKEAANELELMCDNSNNVFTPEIKAAYQRLLKLIRAVKKSASEQFL